MASRSRLGPEMSVMFATTSNVPGVLVSRLNWVPQASCPAMLCHLLVNHYPELYRNVADLGVRVAHRRQRHESDRDNRPGIRQGQRCPLMVENRNDLVDDIQSRLETLGLRPHVDRGEDVPAKSTVPVVRDAEHFADGYPRATDILGNMVVHRSRDVAVQRDEQL